MSWNGCPITNETCTQGCQAFECRAGWCEDGHMTPAASVKSCLTDDFVTCGGGPPGDPNGELAQLHADLRDFLLHVIDMSKGDHYWDVVRGNAEALLRREALRERP